MKDKKGFMYIMECAGYYKVGMTNNSKQRLKSIQSMNPLKVTIKDVFMFDDASIAEAIMHILFLTDRMHGEWFDTEYEFLVHDAKRLQDMDADTLRRKLVDLIDTKDALIKEVPVGIRRELNSAVAYKNRKQYNLSC